MSDVHPSALPRNYVSPFPSAQDIADQAHKEREETTSALKRLRCPACGHIGNIFVGDGGYLTCGIAECPNPDYAESVDFQTTALRAADSMRRLFAADTDYAVVRDYDESRALLVTGEATR